MKRIILSITILIVAAFMFTSCGAPAANNAAGNNGNKPANAANTATAPAADKGAAEAEIKKLMSGMAESLVKGDADALDKMYGDDYTLVDQEGKVQTKAERLAALKSGDVKFSSFTYSDTTIRFNPEVTGAVGITKATFKSTVKGKAVDGEFRVTHVWGKSKDGTWKMYSGQATKIAGGAEPAKADDKKAEEKKPAAAPAANK